MPSLSKAERTIIVLALACSVAIMFSPSEIFSSVLQAIAGQTTCPLGYGAATAKAHLFHSPPPDPSLSTPKLYINCTVMTGDTDNPTVTSFLVHNGRFAYIGNTTDVNAVPSIEGAPPTEVVDLQGAYVTPGLMDGHVHLIPAGMSLTKLHLRGATSKTDFVEAVKRAAQVSPVGEWVLGSSWDEGWWGSELPSAAWIDEVTPDHPVFLIRADGHQGVANSVALEIAGITNLTADVPGGLIHRDADGNPTGILVDAAMKLVTSKIPAPSVEKRLEGLLAAQKYALARGVTAVHDMGRIAFHDGQDAAWNDLVEVFLPAAADGTLRLRVRSFIALPAWRRVAGLIKAHGSSHPSGRLDWGGVKEFYDGSLGSRTALMHSAYSDDDTNFGTLAVDPVTFLKQLKGAHNAGLQIAVHAIGDKAVDDVLDAYTTLDEEESRKIAPAEDTTAQKRGVKEARHRIEHAQHISGEESANRMAALGVITTPNPLHLIIDARVLIARLGQLRRQWSFAFRELSRAGVRAVYSSDWPVVPLDPIGRLYTVCDPSRGDSVEVEEALASLTTGAAYAGFREHDLGMIREGMLADFVVFEGNVPEAVAVAGPRPAVLKTYVGGVCEFGCPGAELALKKEDTVGDGGENKENQNHSEL